MLYRQDKARLRTLGSIDTLTPALPPPLPHLLLILLSPLLRLEKNVFRCRELAQHRALGDSNRRLVVSAVWREKGGEAVEGRARMVYSGDAKATRTPRKFRRCPSFKSHFLSPRAKPLILRFANFHNRCTHLRKPLLRRLLRHVHADGVYQPPLQIVVPQPRDRRRLVAQKAQLRQTNRAG